MCGNTDEWVKENIKLPAVEIPDEFRVRTKAKYLISKNDPYLG
jgi:hypothetical protein